MTALRALLYALARLLGDISAVRRGGVRNRVMGMAAGKVMRELGR